MMGLMYSRNNPTKTNLLNGMHFKIVLKMSLTFNPHPLNGDESIQYGLFNIFLNGEFEIDLLPIVKLIAVLHRTEITLF